MLALSCLAIPAVLVLGLAYWVGALGNLSLAGLPASYLLAVPGVAIVSIAAVARYAVSQERIDRWHGSHDDT